MSRTVHISLGANLGDREGQIARAIAALDEAEGVRVTKRSSDIETDPMAPPQPKYLNAAVEAQCSLSPKELLATLKGIERDMGRTEGEKWGPRVIDLDILFFGDTIMETDDLTIPHVGTAERAFVLEPLAEIAPDTVHPTLGKTVAQLLKELKTE